MRLDWSSMMLKAAAGLAQEPNPGMTVSATVVADVWGCWVGILSLSSSFFSLPSVCFSKGIYSETNIQQASAEMNQFSLKLIPLTLDSMRQILPSFLNGGP